MSDVVDPVVDVGRDAVKGTKKIVGGVKKAAGSRDIIGGFKEIGEGVVGVTPGLNEPIKAGKRATDKIVEEVTGPIKEGQEELIGEIEEEGKRRERELEERKRKEAEEREKEESADQQAEGRRSARARQRSRAVAARGRRSTILTGPLGLPGGQTGGPRTLLGS